MQKWQMNKLGFDYPRHHRARTAGRLGNVGKSGSARGYEVSKKSHVFRRDRSLNRADHSLLSSRSSASAACGTPTQAWRRCQGHARTEESRACDDPSIAMRSYFFVSETYINERYIAGIPSRIMSSRNIGAGVPTTSISYAAMSTPMATTPAPTYQAARPFRSARSGLVSCPVCWGADFSMCGSSRSLWIIHKHSPRTLTWINIAACCPFEGAGFGRRSSRSSTQFAVGYCLNDGYTCAPSWSAA